jgi:anti-sigma B factor antagonist
MARRGLNDVRQTWLGRRAQELRAGLALAIADQTQGMPEFSYSIDRDGPEPVLRLSGDIDIAAVAKLEAGLEQATDEATTGLVLDMSGVTFIDSSGLRVLAELHKRQSGGAGSLTIRTPSSPVVRILELTGMTDMFEISAG